MTGGREEAGEEDDVARVRGGEGRQDEGFESTKKKRKEKKKTRKGKTRKEETFAPHAVSCVRVSASSLTSRARSCEPPS